MEHIFHPLASRDARDIECYYKKISDKLARRFWVELNAAFDEIFEYPKRHHFDPSGYRRRNLIKFPYHVLFTETLIDIRIMVIRHDHRNPSFGMRRR